MRIGENAVRSFINVQDSSSLGRHDKTTLQLKESSETVLRDSSPSRTSSSALLGFRS